MRKLFYLLTALCIMSASVPSATAEVSVGFSSPTVSIDIHLPLFPELVPVPGYPVYYAPRIHANYFFYDGMYWVFHDDNWYASSWYNGPWWLVEPDYVPLFILRIPVRYYRQPPVYFRSWHSHAPPRWGERWGHSWEKRRRGWDKWNRGAAPPRAPLPLYQRRYSEDRYPPLEQQRVIRSRNYRYQPRDRAVRQHFREQAAPVRPESRREREERSRPHGPRQQETRPATPAPQPPPSVRPHEAPSRREERTAPPGRTEPSRSRNEGMTEERSRRGAERREPETPRRQEQKGREQREPQEGGGDDRRGEHRGEGRGR